ncbi:MAG TPA: DJ-1/PfpI family protein, partial [Actinopolymorphaceae bacterium]
MRRWMSRTLVGLGVLMAAAGAITTAGWGPGQQALAANYPEPLPMTDQVRGAVDAAPRPEHDPARPTAVVLIGAQGANAADTLAPYETLAASGKYNVYTAAPVRRPLPLTGGLDVVPDYTFEELARLPGDVDVVVVPALPDGMEPSSDPVRSFVAEQSAAGATVVGVCVGVEVLAGAGLLDGRDATTHWAVIDRFERHFTTVTWKRGVRYVDEGKVVTTAGVLSGVDGALRVLERDFGESVAREAAAAVRWPHYHPGGAATMPVSRLAPPDAVALLNLGYRDPARMGVLLTDGVGEIELASA